MLFPENLNKPVWRNALLRRKIILGTFVSLALISFVGGIFIDYYFSQHNPRRPEPEVGRIYWVTANKVEIYVTKYELVAIRLPGVSFFIWFGAMLYFGVRWKFMQVAVKEPEYRARARVKKKKKSDSD